MWSCYLFDTMTGLISDPIDIPNFSWEVSINSSTLCTTRDKNVGKGDVSGLTVPWDAIPGKTGIQKARNVAPLKTSLLLMWRDQRQRESEPVEYPILVGAIGNRKDTMLDTSFDLMPTLDLLDLRYMVREGVFGANKIEYQADNGHMVMAYTTSDSVSFSNLSQRAIACSVIDYCTNKKPGGSLPIDLPYLNEVARHYNADSSDNQNYWREYKGYDVANDSCKDILDKLASTDYGPDMQFRPYLSDDIHVRQKFVAGSDSEPYLSQTGLVQTVTCFKGGGTLQNVSIDHDYPAERVYGTGSGSEDKMNCWLSEDLTLVNQRDPWPLVELSRQDTNLSGTSIGSYYDSILNLKKQAILQLSGEINANDPYAPQMGAFWPGEIMEVSVSDFPGLPDDTYQMRLMEMSGDQSNTVKLVFDICFDPIY